MTNYSSFANGGITLIKPYQAGKPIEEVINSIYNDVICKEKFGFIVFAGKKLQ